MRADSDDEKEIRYNISYKPSTTHPSVEHRAKESDPVDLAPRHAADEAQKRHRDPRGLTCYNGQGGNLTKRIWIFRSVEFYPICSFIFALFGHYVNAYQEPGFEHGRRWAKEANATSLSKM